MKSRNYNDITIVDGETESSVVSLVPGYQFSGLILPAITTSTALTFEIGYDSDNLLPLYENGSEYSLTIDNTLANTVRLNKDIFSPFTAMKIKVADAQSGDKAIKVISEAEN